jgi:protein tyrosine/serine phosphatase
MFTEIDYPVLVHCKSGADRAGLMSAVYLLQHEKRPFEEAMGQLSLRFGHVKQAKTGILDFFFEAYRQDNEKSPITFMDWVNTDYDPAALKKSFMSQWWANSLVDRLLRRE